MAALDNARAATHAAAEDNRRGDGIEKFAELHRSMTTKLTLNHAASVGIERGDERRRAVADVIVRLPLELARSQRQQQLVPIQPWICASSSSQRTEPYRANCRVRRYRTFSMNNGSGEKLNVSARAQRSSVSPSSGCSLTGDGTVEYTHERSPLY